MGKTNNEMLQKTLEHAFQLGWASDTDEVTQRMVDELSRRLGTEYTESGDNKTAIEDAYIAGVVTGWYPQAEELDKDQKKYGLGKEDL